MIVIETYEYAHQAEAARAYIESNGIPCELKDHMTVAVDPALSQPVGGVKLMVPEAHVQDAKELLAGNNEPAGHVFLKEERKLLPPVIPSLIALCVAGGAAYAVDPQWAMPVLGVSAVIVGSFFRGPAYQTCSRPSCRAIIPDQASACPRCHGDVAGPLPEGQNHLQALEAYEDGQRW